MNIDRISHGQQTSKCVASNQQVNWIDSSRLYFLPLSHFQTTTADIVLTFFFSFFNRNCSHFKVRHDALEHPVQTAKQPPQRFGEGIKVASRFAMPVDSTINYTMWVSINLYAARKQNGKCLERIDKVGKCWRRKCVYVMHKQWNFSCFLHEIKGNLLMPLLWHSLRT